MPAQWLLLHMASILVGQVHSGKPQALQLPGNVKITYETGSYDVASKTWTFDNGVTLIYDVTTIHAKHLVIDQANSHGKASGDVHLDDPVATVDAQDIEIWYADNQRRGQANDAYIQIGSSRLKAKEVDISPDLWVLREVEGTTSRANPPWYEVHSPLVTLKPGQSGTLKKPTLYILGHRIATFPDRTFNLDQRSEGITIPGFNYSRQYGLGASWGGGFLIDHATDVAFAVAAFPDARPGYGVTVSRSLLSDVTPTMVITPSSDFGERFSFGFLEDIAVTSPEGEDRYLRNSKDTVSVDTIWNTVLTDRNTSAAFSKPLEGVYEVGGLLGNSGYDGQARLQSIKELGEPVQERLDLVGAFSPPVTSIGSKVRTIMRFDSDVFLGNSKYGWIRGMAGLAFMPIPQVRISAARYQSLDAGTQQFPIDGLYSKDGYSIRGDLNLGPTKISYMLKYDDALRWFDKEYSISQVIGCFEPFLLYRQNPSDYQLGLRLRLDNLTDLLNKRNFQRTAPVAKVISPGPDGNP